MALINFYAHSEINLRTKVSSSYVLNKHMCTEYLYLIAREKEFSINSMLFKVVSE
jgi:hypothetical protein